MKTQRRSLCTGISICALLFTAGSSSAQSDSETVVPVPVIKQTLILEYSLVDLPFASYSGRVYPGNTSIENKNKQGDVWNSTKIKSPEQAVQITNGVTQAAHWGIAQIPVFKKRKKLQYIVKAAITGVFDFVFTTQPYGTGWMHEEGHRAVMANSYTSSYNPFTLFNKKKDASGGGLHSVSYVLDTNLVMMKAADNANFVRLSTAGGEMQVYSVAKMQQTSFFNQQYRDRFSLQYPINSFNYILSMTNLIGYIGTCANKDELAKTTKEQIDREGSSQELRDFTGMDFAAWAYDLNHPNEAYANRGQNPYGNGYERYIYGDKLSDDEYSWLKKQASLSYLNMLSPSIIFINSIPLSKNMSFNFSGRYYPTSFGNQAGIDLMLKTRGYNFFLSPHLNQNRNNNFFGLEAMLYEKPIAIKDQYFLTTFRIIADLQPNNQSFRTSKAAFTGLAGINLAWRANKIFYPYIAVEAKNYGWIAGNAFLKETVSCKVGLSARLNYSMNTGR